MATKIEKLLNELRLKMPLDLTVTDPMTRQPMALSYANMHELLVIDTSALMVDSAVVANLYAEMVRFQKAVEWQADRAASRFAQWKADQVKAAKSSTPKATVQQIEAEYRTHADYDEIANEEARYRAIVGVLAGLAEAFRIKARMMSDHTRIVGNYEAATRSEVQEDRRVEGFARMTQEVGRIASESIGALRDVDAQVQGRKARPLPRGNE